LLSVLKRGQGQCDIFAARPGAIIRYMFDEDESFTMKLAKNKADSSVWEVIVSIFYYVIMNMSVHTMSKVSLVILCYEITSTLDNIFPRICFLIGCTEGIDP
jgi:hypothetical protein